MPLTTCLAVVDGTLDSVTSLKKNSTLLSSFVVPGGKNIMYDTVNKKRLTKTTPKIKELTLESSGISHLLR